MRESRLGLAAPTQPRLDLRKAFGFPIHTAILSGDLDADGHTSDNVYHVVTGVDATIDGSNLTLGNADGSGYDSAGGMYNDSSSPTNDSWVWSSGATWSYTN